MEIGQSGPKTDGRSGPFFNFFAFVDWRSRAGEPEANLVPARAKPVFQGPQPPASKLSMCLSVLRTALTWRWRTWLLLVTVLLFPRATALLVVLMGKWLIRSMVSILVYVCKEFLQQTGALITETEDAMVAWLSAYLQGPPAPPEFLRPAEGHSTADASNLARVVPGPPSPQPYPPRRGHGGALGAEPVARSAWSGWESASSSRSSRCCSSSLTFRDAQAGFRYGLYLRGSFWTS